MDGEIWYLNTDLDMRSHDDLTPIAESFREHGLFSLTLERGNDGTWFACFELDGSDESRREPAVTIEGLLRAIESLSQPLRAVWDRCTLREFNIGYDCGVTPWAFNQNLSNSLLTRIAAVGGSLRITLYPDVEDPRWRGFEAALKS
ncbi:MAG: hypothetical protein IT450_23700 [Phycisphaerales bacterium]|nr:hypothetical protein [Phycisphaerales bacterium]